MWADVEAISGGKLTGETVSIIDAGTNKVIASATVDDDGKIFAKIPENKPVHIKLEGEVPPMPVDDSDTGAEHDQAHLFVKLYDSTGHPLAEGVKVTLEGGPNNVSLDLVTDTNGSISPHVEGGSYELHVNKEVFVAHTLRSFDLKHKGASQYEFQLGHDEGEPEYQDLEREHRVTKADLDLDLE